jgi:hypothetical protein
VEGLHTHGDILVDPRPVLPGPFQLMFTFPLPADGRFDQQVAYATKALDILITPAEADVDPSGLEDLGHADVGGRRFRRFTRRSLSKGDRVSLRLAAAAPVSSPATGATFDGVLSGNTIPLILGGLAVGLGVLALFWRPASRRAAVSLSDGGRLGPDVRRAALLEQIADLDDRLESGAIERKSYEARRDALKAEVVDLTQSLSSGRPS